MSAVSNRATLGGLVFEKGNSEQTRALNLLANLEKTTDRPSELAKKVNCYIRSNTGPSLRTSTAAMTGILALALTSLFLLPFTSVVVTALKTAGQFGFFFGIPISMGIVAWVASYYFNSELVDNSKTELENYWNDNQGNLENLLTQEIRQKEAVQRKLISACEKIDGKTAENFGNAAIAIKETDLAKKVLKDFFPKKDFFSKSE